MEPKRLKPKPTQCEKIVKALLDAKGDWVSGRYFLHTLYLSQFHARIKELEEKGVEIEHSSFTDDLGFKSYRILQEKKQEALFEVGLSRLSRLDFVN